MFECVLVRSCSREREKNKRETEGEIFYESAKCGKMGLKNKKIPMRPFYTHKDITRKKLKQ